MESTTSIFRKPSENYFKKHIFGLNLLGISLTGNESIAYKFYSFVLLSSTVYVYVVLDVYELFKSDFATLAGLIIYAASVIVVMLKTTIFLKNRIQLGKILSMLQQEPFLPNPRRGRADEEEKLIRECNWKINIMTNIYGISCIIYLCGSGGYALSTRLRNNDSKEWMMSYGPLTVLNVTYSPNYEITWFYQSFSILIIGLLNIAIDLTFIGILLHVSYQFKILQNFIRIIMTLCHEDTIKDQDKDTQCSSRETVPLDHQVDASKIPWKYLQESIKEAARYHQAIIDIAQAAEDMFRYLVLQEFLITLATLCFELYSTQYETSIIGWVRHIIEYCVCVFQIISICYWGEQVVFESQEVGKAVFESNFVGADVRYQKSLVLIACRSQKPTKLTAGKFTDIRLATFTWVMRTSYTVFMVIRNVSEEKM